MVVRLTTTNWINQPSTSFCGESDNLTLIGSTPSPAGGQFLWQYSTDGSNFIDAVSTNNGKDYTTGKLAEGTHYFRRKYSTTSGYICEKLSDIITIVVKSKPVQPNINSNSPACEGSTIVLQTTPITGASYQWLSPESSGEYQFKVIPLPMPMQLQKVVISCKLKSVVVRVS